MKRNRNFKLYQKNLTNTELKLKISDLNFISSFAMPVLAKNRDSIVNNLLKNNIEVRPLIAGNMGRKPMWKGKNDDLPNCDLIDKNGFYVPNHQDLTKEEILLITKIINTTSQ